MKILLNIVRIALGLLMLLFVAVQYNDPDRLWWMSIYGIAVVAMLFSVWRPHWLQSDAGRWLLMLGIAALAVAVWRYWPSKPNFWREEVYWPDKTIRDGMGVMIAFAVTLFAAPVAWARNNRS